MPSSTTVIPSMDRKVKKPLMEKRRRARINQCLSELKNVLLESYSNTPNSAANQQRTSKLEKADILEMTVQYVRSRTSKSSLTTDSSQISAFARQSYVDAFTKCAQTALRFVPVQDQGLFMAHLSVSLNEYLKKDSIAQSNLTLSIPQNCGGNQASQPTPPFTMANYPNQNSMISPSSTTTMSDCESPCDSTFSYSSSSSNGDGRGLLTPLTPIKIWRPW